MYKNRKLNEGFMEFISEYSGLIGTAIAIRLFGKKIFIGIIGGIMKRHFSMKNKTLMEKVLKLLIDEPETVYIKYRKINDYYQLSIELKHYSHDTIFDDGTNPFKQINSEDFPIRMRVYSDDFVDVRGLGSSDKVKVDGIYGLVESYINDLVSEEDKTLRDQDEYSDIVDMFSKHIKSKETEDFLEELKSTKINSLIDEISEFTSIGKDIVREALDNVINGYRSVRTEHYTGIIESFYDSLKHLYNKTLKENVDKNMKKRIVKLNENDIMRLVQRVIKEGKNDGKRVGHRNFWGDRYEVDVTLDYVTNIVIDELEGLGDYNDEMYDDAKDLAVYIIQDILSNLNRVSYDYNNELWDILDKHNNQDDEGY